MNKNAEGKPIEPKGCAFFSRCEKNKYDDDPKKSAQKRSEVFREFHAEICPNCRQPKDACRLRKIAAVKRKFAKQFKEGSRKEEYVDDWKITEAVEKQICISPNESKYTPVAPEWYTP